MQCKVCRVYHTIDTFLALNLRSQTGDQDFQEQQLRMWRCPRGAKCDVIAGHTLVLRHAACLLLMLMGCSEVIAISVPGHGTQPELPFCTPNPSEILYSVANNAA